MKTATIKLTAAIAIEGNIVRAGEIITVPEVAAKNLMHRGRAVLATEADEPILEEQEVENETEAAADAATQADEPVPAKPAKAAKGKK